jgi:hypothetical protein
MELLLLRYSSQEHSTLGALFEVKDGKKNFLCYTLEDEHRDEKVMHETRIPEGTYRVTLRTWGGFHNSYSNRFKSIHKGMLWLRDVPNFEYILLHCGNSDHDTSGCILVGDNSLQNVTQRGSITNSTLAYKRIYPAIAEAIEEGEDVSFTIQDFDAK